MNYIERVLEKSTALWRAREENLQKRLALLRGKTGAAEKEGETLSPPAEEDAPGAAVRSAGEAVPGAADHRGRLMQKLTGDGGLPETAGAAGKNTDDGLRAGRTGAEPLRGAAALVQRFESGTDWLSKRLDEGKTEGLSGERAHERIVELERARTLAGTEVFSKSLERDARRYDGGFLLY